LLHWLLCRKRAINPARGAVQMIGREMRAGIACYCFEGCDEYYRQRHHRGVTRTIAPVWDARQFGNQRRSPFGVKCREIRGTAFQVLGEHREDVLELTAGGLPYRLFRQFTMLMASLRWLLENYNFFQLFKKGIQ
jgi:hypothetical protein